MFYCPYCDYRGENYYEALLHALSHGHIKIKTINDFNYTNYRRAV